VLDLVGFGGVIFLSVEPTALSSSVVERLSAYFNMLMSLLDDSPTATMAANDSLFPSLPHYSLYRRRGVGLPQLQLIVVHKNVPLLFFEYHILSINLHG